MSRVISPNDSSQRHYTARIPAPSRGGWQNLTRQVKEVFQHLLGGLVFHGRGVSKRYNSPTTENLPPLSKGTTLLRRCLGLGLSHKMHIQPGKPPSLKSWKLERMTVKVGDCLIDVTLLRHKDSTDKRWILHTGGNGECMAGTLPTRGVFVEHDLRLNLNLEAKRLEHQRTFNRQAQSFLQSDVMLLADELESSVLFFDYPSIGLSTGKLSVENINRAYQGVLQYLEDEKKGEGAREVVLFGRSIGGAVQADALRNHRWKPDIRYTMVKDRTFAHLNEVIQHLVGGALAKLALLIGLDYNTSAKSLNAKVPEIIVQCAGENDEMIPSSLSLRNSLLKTRQLANKTFINAQGSHGNSDIVTHNHYLPEDVIHAIASKILANS